MSIIAWPHCLAMGRHRITRCRHNPAPPSLLKHVAAAQVLLAGHNDVSPFDVEHPRSV